MEGGFATVFFERSLGIYFPIVLRVAGRCSGTNVLQRR